MYYIQISSVLFNSFMSLGMSLGLDWFSLELELIDIRVMFTLVNIYIHLRPELEGGGGGKSRFSSFYIFDQSCWRRTRRKKLDRNLTARQILRFTCNYM